MISENIYSKRGFLNKLNIAIYIIFQLVMTFWLFLYWVEVGTHMNNECIGAYKEACENGSAIGASIGTMMIILPWALFGLIGAVIIYMTRPKVIGTRTVEE